MTGSSAATRVSVLVAAYNRERYVAECLDSILATRYPNLEVLVVDDGSTDATPVILADREAGSGGVVRVLRHPGGRNRGWCASLDLAISRASGAYVCFLDSDDVMMTHRFDRAVPLLDADPALDGVIEIVEVFFDRREDAEAWGDRPHRYGPRTEAIPAADFLRACLLDRTCSMHTSSILVRRSLFEKSGVFRPGRERSSDFHLWLRLAACGRFAVGEACRPVNLYRRHADNVWTPQGGDSVRDLLVLAEIAAWARDSPHVSAANVAVLDEAYRRKARWCLSTLRAEGDRGALVRLARALLRRDPSWALDRGFVGNLGRGILGRPRPAGRKRA
jgi:glycosyltransferase involved in cell wall biosynthesis